MTAGEETAVTELVAPRTERSLWHPLVVLPELAWMLVLIFGYSLARLFVLDPAAGRRNAEALWHFERLLQLPSEAWVQGLVLGSPSLLRMANEYYASAHFPVTAAFLFWVYVWRHDDWSRVRNAMTAFTALALLIEAVWPMAPPRLMPAFGMIDTGVALGQSVYPASPDNGVANQYAAMPSVHVGWAVLVAVGIVLIGRGRWRWIAVVHPVLTVAVVTVTANHYWADGVVATVLVAAVFTVPALVGRRPAREPVPEPARLRPGAPSARARAAEDGIEDGIEDGFLLDEDAVRLRD